MVTTVTWLQPAWLLGFWCNRNGYKTVTTVTTRAIAGFCPNRRKAIRCQHHANAFDPQPGNGRRKVICRSVDCKAPSERVAIGKAIEDEIRQRAKERQKQAGEQYGRGKGKLVEDLPQAIAEKSRDQVAEIVEST